MIHLIIPRGWNTFGGVLLLLLLLLPQNDDEVVGGLNWEKLPRLGRLLMNAETRERLFIPRPVVVVSFVVILLFGDTDDDLLGGPPLSIWCR